MGEWVELKAEDGHELAAYVAKPEQAAVGCVVILQEIFGINAYIRSVVDGYAAEGYLTIAPAFFDRLERGVELQYDGPGLAERPRPDAEVGYKRGAQGYCLGLCLSEGRR